MPYTGAIAFQYEFLREGILELAFFHVHKVHRIIVNIHHHVILHVLVRGSRVEIKIITAEIQVECRIEHITTIIALSIGRRIACLSSLRVQQSVWETVLSDVLIIGNIIDIPTVGGFKYQS